MPLAHTNSLRYGKHVLNVARVAFVESRQSADISSASRHTQPHGMAWHGMAWNDHAPSAARSYSREQIEGKTSRSSWLVEKRQTATTTLQPKASWNKTYLVSDSRDNWRMGTATTVPSLLITSMHASTRLCTAFSLASNKCSWRACHRKPGIYLAHQFRRLELAQTASEGHDLTLQRALRMDSTRSFQNPR